jgi:hypothetical protein
MPVSGKGRPESNYSAKVHAADGVRFAATAESPKLLTTQLEAYVRERCDDVLWPQDARQVQAYLEADNPDAAISLYFARVGDRWDDERLELQGLDHAYDLGVHLAVPRLRSHGHLVALAGADPEHVIHR